MNMKKWILIGTVMMGMSTPPAMAQVVGVLTAGAEGAALLRVLVTKATEAGIAKTIESLIARGFSKPAPETYEMTQVPALYEDNFSGYMGNLPPFQRYRQMWLDPASGAQRFETTFTTAGKTLKDNQPFYWFPNSENYACKDASAARSYDYSRRAYTRFRVSNRVVQASPSQGVQMHPARFVIQGNQMPANCAAPQYSAGFFSPDITEIVVPRNSSVDVPLRSQHMEVTTAFVAYKTN